MPEQRIAAATLLLLRDAADLEVFMVSRHRRIESFSGALVFPGGKLDPGDADERLIEFCDGADDDPLRAFRIAAIRESFEECGVLLARRAGESSALDAAAAARLRPQRARLISGDATMLELCQQQRLRLATGALTTFARWITPRGQPKIFDTWFFIAVAPPGQEARHDGHENLDSMWIRPADASERAERAELSIVFPTRMSLRKLARSATCAEALRTAAADPGASLAVRPVAEPRPDGRVMTIPAEAGYAARRVHLSKDGSRLTVLD